jgi:hypothetical protein
MSYPPRWIVTPGSKTLPDQYDNFGYPYIYISRDVVSTTVSVSRTVTSTIAYYKSHYQGKLVSNKSIKLANGYAGRLLTFNATDDGVAVVVKEIIVAKGKVGYFLTIFGEKDKAGPDTTLFHDMYVTWRATP